MKPVTRNSTSKIYGSNFTCNLYYIIKMKIKWICFILIFGSFFNHLCYSQKIDTLSIQNQIGAEGQYRYKNLRTDTYFIVEGKELWQMNKNKMVKIFKQQSINH